jgi:hypothetical protein
VKDAFRPESLLPLKVDEPHARDLIRSWYKRQWLAPNALRTKALTDTVKGIYLPYWTFDAQAHALWRADAGTYYYVNEGGKRVQRVQWTPASGELDHVFDDDLVPASAGVHTARLKGIEPFPTGALIPYDAGYLAGWTVERYQIDLVAAAQRSRGQMEQKVQAMCGSAVPGDTYRNLRVRAGYSGQTFKHILAPLWMLQYRYGASNFQVVMNGYSGKISGDYPKSWIKIAFAALVVIVVLLILFSVGGNR